MKRFPHILSSPLPASCMQEGGLLIVLPIPSQILSPNGRGHWRTKAAAVKRARWQAKLATLNALNGRKAPEVYGYTLCYHWKTNHSRDDDNAIASAKTYLDGICDILGINDKNLRFQELIHDKSKTCPRLEILLHH